MLTPDQLVAGLNNPALLDAEYDAQVRMWIQRRAEMGFELVTKPTPARMTPCLDPKEPWGSMWVMVAAKWFHHGKQGVVTGDDMQELKEYAASIGAEAGKRSGGVAKMLEAMTPEQAAAAVQNAAPTKERDDDRDHW